jgi:3-hydroxyisobutyrate dehydrogenase-like beta-hydroxyacid dehydrogenase
MVFDLREEAMRPLTERQARKAVSPKDLADQCETVFISLPTIKSFREAVMGPGGVLEGRGLKTLVNTCTVGAPLVAELERACSAKGVALVDCPISGGPGGARAGTLSVMVSGNREAIERVRPLISLWGPTVTVAGEKPGAAQILKLANNIMFAVSLVVTSEAFVMGAKGGVDPDAMVTAINAGSGRNYATMVAFPNVILPRHFNFGAPLHILMKDIDLAIEQGEALGVPMWLCQMARLVYKHAIFEGRENDDISTMVQLIEKGAHFELPKKA